ncbi:MAG TPA: DUF4097 family beta strand repeat-containing protein [Candidatus Eisenbacteria bacterium]|nr:DUF4097 family beta strand repeat-containing protein [Candidatus Eisenbacteria bacterium]
MNPITASAPLLPRPLGLVTALLLAAAPAQALTLHEQSQFQAALGGMAEVQIENSRGTTSVEPSADGALHLVATKIVRGNNQGELSRLARQTEVEARRSGDRYLVLVRYPMGGEIHISLFDIFHGHEMPSVEVKLDVQVPAGRAVTVRSTSGDLQARGLAGRVSLQSTSGDLRIEDLRGPLRLATTSGDVHATALASAVLRSTSGDITVDGVRGPLDVHTTSGVLRLRGVTDSVTVSSISGDVSVDGTPATFAASSSSGDILVTGLVRGAVHVATTSGDIHLPLGPGMPGASITSSSGDVELRLDRALGARFDISTVSGAIDANLGLQVQDATRHVLRGTYGSGRAPIELRTTSGDIRLVSSGG